MYTITLLTKTWNLQFLVSTRIWTQNLTILNLLPIDTRPHPWVSKLQTLYTFKHNQIKKLQKHCNTIQICSFFKTQNLSLGQGITKKKLGFFCLEEKLEYKDRGIPMRRLRRRRASSPEKTKILCRFSSSWVEFSGLFKLAGRNPTGLFLGIWTARKIELINKLNWKIIKIFKKNYNL